MNQQPDSPPARVSTGAGANVDPGEVAHFAALAAKWWDPNGAFRPLHQIGPVRLAFIRDQVCSGFERDRHGPAPFEGLSFLDIGCGGGLIAEPLATLGARVTGIDPAESGIEAARLHAGERGLSIEYRDQTAESLAAEGRSFDVVLCLEVVEHVPDVGALVATASGLVKPGGILILSTINRTAKSFLLAIVGAEYVLRWLARGTHQWDRFVTPAELGRHVEAAGCDVREVQGMVYGPISGTWSLAHDTDVNYIMAVTRRSDGN